MIGKLFGRGSRIRLERTADRNGSSRLQTHDLTQSDMFSPTQPQFTARGLIGRERELARIMRAICREHAHVVLFGERGRGKSSLANCVVEQLQQVNWVVARASCDSRTDFDTLVRNLMRSLPASLAADLAPDPTTGCESLLSRDPLTPRDVAELPGLFGGRHLTLMVEEFDRLADSAVRSLVADATKQLSDRGARVTFMLVGVADEASELIGDNASVHRSIVPVELPLLPDAAIRSVIDTGFRVSGIVAAHPAIDLIVELARGTPYIAHLIGLRAAQAVIDAGRDDLTTADIITAARQITQDNDSVVKPSLADANRSKDEEALNRHVIQISNGKRDIYGRFQAEPNGPGKVQVAGTAMDEGGWEKLFAAGLVRRVGKPPSRTFSFASSHLEHYVLLKSLALDGRRAQRAVLDRGQH